ncbi:MAG: translocation/assembly module TamB domain-containing protein [Verrucomicrobiales bacterium]|nr:translocation/assembly module TamB domain-containing protein [Verrucomicrobiales bacterium]
MPGTRNYARVGQRCSHNLEVNQAQFVEDAEHHSPPEKVTLVGKSKRKARVMGVLFCLLVIAVLFGAGPGFRSVAHLVIAKTAGEHGLKGDFSLKGNLWSGLAIHDLSLNGGNGRVRKVDVAEAKIEYRFFDLVGRFSEYNWLKTAAVDSVDLHISLPERRDSIPKGKVPADKRHSDKQSGDWWNLLSGDISLQNIAIQVDKGKRHFAAEGFSLRLSPEGGDRVHVDRVKILDLVDCGPYQFPVSRGEEELRIAPVSLSENLQLSGFLCSPEGVDFSLESNGSVFEFRYRFAGEASIALRDGPSFNLDSLKLPVAGSVGKLKFDFTGDVRRPATWEIFGIADFENLAWGKLEIGNASLRTTGENTVFSAPGSDTDITVKARLPFRKVDSLALLSSIALKLDADFSTTALPGALAGSVQGKIENLQVLKGNTIRSGTFSVSSDDVSLSGQKMEKLLVKGAVESDNRLAFEGDFRLDDQTGIEMQGALNTSDYTYSSTGSVKIKEGTPVLDELYRGGADISWKGAGDLKKLNHDCAVTLQLSHGVVRIDGTATLAGGMVTIPRLTISDAGDEKLYLDAVVPTRWKSDEHSQISLRMDCKELQLSSVACFFTPDELPLKGALSGSFTSAGAFQSLQTKGGLRFVPELEDPDNNSRLTLDLAHSGNPLVPSTWDVEIEGFMSGLQWQETPLENLSIKVETFEDSVQKVVFGNLALAQSTAIAEVRASVGLTNATDFSSLCKEPVSFDGSLSVQRIEQILQDFAIRTGVPLSGGVSLEISDVELDQGHVEQGSMILQSGNLAIDRTRLGKVEATANVTSTDNVEAKLSLPLDGVSSMSGSGVYDIATGGYAGKLSTLSNLRAPGKLREIFASRNMAKLLPAAARITWQGRGSLPDKIHRGKFDAQAEGLTLAEGAEPLALTLEGRYTEKSAFVSNLQVSSRPVNLEGSFSWDDDRLKVPLLTGTRNGSEILYTKGELPLKFGKFLPVEFFQQNGAANMELRTSALPVHELMSLVQAAPGWRGNLDTHITLTGSPAKPEVVGQISVADISVWQNDRNLPVGKLSLDLTAKNQKASIEGEFQHPDVNPLTIKAETAFAPALWVCGDRKFDSEAIHASAKMQKSSLSFLSSQVPGLMRVDGTVALDLDLSGTIREPKILGNGEILAQRLRFKNRDAPRIYDIESKIRFSDETIHLDRFHAIVAGGVVDLTGKARLDGKEPVLDISVTGKEVLVARTPDINLRTDADLKLSGPWSKTRISGELAITNSRFYKNLDLIPMGVPFRKKSALPDVNTTPGRSGGSSRALDFGLRKEPFSNWPLAVHIYTKDPFLVRGNVAESELESDLVVVGTLGKPVPKGFVKMKEGDVRLPFSKVNVEVGKVVFTEQTGFNGALEFKARARSGDYNVNIYAFNRLLDPKHVLTSVPPLPQEDIVSLLATGYTGGELGGADAGSVAASRAASLLFKNIKQSSDDAGRQPGLLDKLEERTELELGKVDPETGAQTVGGRVKLWKQLFFVGDVDSQSDYRALLKYVFQYR